VALVADGLSNREVAWELGLSEHRVKKYLFHIFDKLGDLQPSRTRGLRGEPRWCLASGVGRRWGG
jgi:transposase